MLGLIVRCDTQAQVPGSTELTPLQEHAPGSAPIPESSQAQLCTGEVNLDIFGRMMHSQIHAAAVSSRAQQ